MSNDILDRICLFLETDEDVLQFALSCYRFLEIGRRGLYMRNKISKGSWAGERIITVGDYAYDEYPDNVLTEEEKEIMEDKELYDYTYEFKDLSTCYCCSLSRKSKEAYGYLFEPVIFPTYTEDSKFVLFNVTANQYVRANGIPDKHDLNFGHIVLFQTCWSTDPSVTINCKEELNREPWAGHRLEITTIDCIDKDAKDVSEEVINKVVSIFDQDNGNC
ncbi:hypothetical protein FB645_001557 [Coemansia sp. IMI 203386]|nr:hypothetical protein FB645_001557 [Coemansia sp. IMI 203386]